MERMPTRACLALALGIFSFQLIYQVNLSESRIDAESTPAANRFIILELNDAVNGVSNGLIVPSIANLNQPKRFHGHNKNLDDWFSPRTRESNANTDEAGAVNHLLLGIHDHRRKVSARINRSLQHPLNQGFGKTETKSLAEYGRSVGQRPVGDMFAKTHLIVLQLPLNTPERSDFHQNDPAAVWGVLATRIDRGKPTQEKDDRFSFQALHTFPMIRLS